MKSVQDLVALAKARPGQLNYASGGVGSTPHLSGALFASMAGINIVHVPYKGGAQATVELPGVPTVHEAGLPGYDVNPWYGVPAYAGNEKKMAA